MAFHLLSEAIRRYVRDQEWEQLRPIQAAAIERIVSSEANYILASRTASGKTEAAFLPVLSKVDFRDPGVQVLYISPLVALINDQFARIESLCKYLDVTVTKWHGEANRSQKEKLLRDPGGIVLITPESIEAMFVNKPYNVTQLFSNLRYVVIDEIHAFIGTDRGVQLVSLLSRLRGIQSNPFLVIGLSATIGDYEEAKKFTGDSANTKVLLDRTAKEISVFFRYFEYNGQELPVSLLMDLYKETRHDKVLVFPNSRGRAEEIAVKLKKISECMRGHSHYYSHHSSVDRGVREYVEFFAKNSSFQPFCIACTSTLELGIDIGAVDEVVQIDATPGVASLIQRVGRSGRKEGRPARLFLYATNPWSLLQSIACWLLYQEGFIEPPARQLKPYDILLHQALSIVKAHSGMRYALLIRQLQENPAFSGIDLHETKEIIAHLVRSDLLEFVRDELIIGIEGEKIVNHRDFYSVFKTEDNFKVVHAGHTIGEIPFSPQLVSDSSILLSARIWRIRSVDQRLKKIEVVPAEDGKKPLFFGNAGNIHPRIRETMAEILFSETRYDFLDQASANGLRSLRNDFSAFEINNPATGRPLLVGDKQQELFTFTGTRINRTLHLLLSAIGIKAMLDDRNSSLLIDAGKEELVNRWQSLFDVFGEIDQHIGELLETNPALLDFSKWGIYLPRHLQVRLLREKYYAMEETFQFLERIRLVENR